MQLKTNVKGADKELTNNNYKLEMNELVESDPEIYAPDHSGSPPRPNVFAQLSGLFEDRDDSLQPVDDHKECVKRRKADDVKLNNSFTGPYPTDPTEFGHNDKGANA